MTGFFIPRHMINKNVLMSNTDTFYLLFVEINTCFRMTERQLLFFQTYCYLREHHCNNCCAVYVLICRIFFFKLEFKL